MVFDDMNLSKKHIKVGNKKNWRRSVCVWFCYIKSKLFENLYKFLSAGYKNIDVDTGTVINYNDFAKLYPIFHFDLTAQETSIFENSLSPKITVSYILEGTPGKYFVYIIVVSGRKAIIKV